MSQSSSFVRAHLNIRELRTTSLPEGTPISMGVVDQQSTEEQRRWSMGMPVPCEVSGPMAIDRDLWSEDEFPWDGSTGSHSNRNDSLDPSPNSNQPSSQQSLHETGGHNASTRKERKHPVISMKHTATGSSTPLQISNLLLPVRWHFCHSEVSHERTIDTYLQWVRSDQPINDSVQPDEQRNPSRLFGQRQSVSLSRFHSLRGISTLLARKLMIRGEQHVANCERTVREAIEGRRSFDGLKRASSKNMSLSWYLGHRLDAWA